MATIRCPHCGSPVMVRDSRWECGYCGDFGSISSLQPSEKAKLMGADKPSVRVTITVTDSSEEEPPRRFSRSELEDMVRRWDFDENEWACRDLLIAAFPQMASHWSGEELAEMDTMDLLLQTGQRDPQTVLEMAKLLLTRQRTTSRIRRRLISCWVGICTTCWSATICCRCWWRS